MTPLIVYVTLCSSLLALSRANPIMNSTMRTGHCAFMRDMDQYTQGAFVPQCDSEGNYVPQQCCSITGYCWCVNVITGEEISNTRAVPGDYPFDCGKDYYCPYYWSHYGSRCFAFINSPKPWVEAESYCNFEGGNLASVHSEKENHFVQSLTRGYTHNFPETWLGGHDAVKNCFWMWADGTKFDYSNWYMDYNIKRTEHCLLMNVGYEWKWNYASCNETRPFVCVKDKWH